MITRTIHTVGQGAFYSESINGFRMVYDCGSRTLNASELKKRVKSDLNGNTDIDLLFISHFDADHINGVQYLNPKIVVLPFLSRNQIFLLKTYNKVFGDSRYIIELAENPQSIFPDAHIIRVMPDGFERNINPIDETPVYSENEISLDGQLPINIKSNTILRLLNDWEYIPYNPNWDKYFDAFKEKATEDLDWNKLTDLQNGAYVKKYLSVLKSIYNSLKSKNLHSLVVYSNSTDIEWMKIYCHCHHVWWSELHSFPIGCIYFGDALIKKEWLHKFYDALSTERTKRVGMMQVPHHGSYLSKGQLILKDEQDKLDDPILCFISVGDVNSYGHPSANVIQDLNRNNGIVTLVTERVSSLLYCTD